MGDTGGLSSPGLHGMMKIDHLPIPASGLPVDAFLFRFQTKGANGHDLPLTTHHNIRNPLAVRCSTRSPAIMISMEQTKSLQVSTLHINRLAPQMFILPFKSLLLLMLMYFHI